MPLNDLVAPNAILPALKVNSKKQVLQELAARAAVLTGQNERAIFDILMQREKLGSTAVGNGIAIPHGKMPGLTRLFGLFARLDRLAGQVHLDAGVRAEAPRELRPCRVPRRLLGRQPCLSRPQR